MLRKHLIITLAGLFFLQPCLTFAANKYSLAYQYGKAYYTTDISKSGVIVDDYHTQYKLIFGYNYNKYFTTELYYTDLGQIKITGNTGASFTHNGTTTTFTADNSEYTYNYKAVGANVLLKSNATLSYYYAKIGVLHWWDDYQMSSSGVSSDSGSASGSAPLAGIGYNAQIPYLPNVSLRIDYDITKIDNNQLWLFNAGLAVSF